MTANEDMLDLGLRRAIAQQRFTDAEVRRLLEKLAAGDVRFAEWLRRTLTTAPRSIRTKRFRQIARRLRERRNELLREIRLEMNGSLRSFIKQESDHQVSILETAIPVQLDFKTVTASQLSAALFNDPFAEGHILSTVASTLAVADRRRLTNALRIGILQGLTVEEMVRRIVGTRGAKFADGLLAITRRNTRTIVRTAFNHAANAARNLVWLANADVIEGVMWLSTLDGRTSAICRARDGKVGALKPGAPIPEGARRLVPPTARPPAHFNCRSTTTGIISVNGVVQQMGERPFVRDSRTRRFRERDFRAEARTAAGAGWSNMTRAQRRDAIRRRRDRWGRENIGRVPSSTNYDEWLRKQPRAFVDDVLGQRKAGLFLSGEVRLDQMVNQFGNELTLADLQRRHPSAFD